MAKRPKLPTKVEMRHDSNAALNGLWLFELELNDAGHIEGLGKAIFRISSHFTVRGKVATADDQLHSLMLEWTTQPPQPPLPPELCDVGMNPNMLNDPEVKKKFADWERQLEQTKPIPHHMIIGAGELHGDASKVIARLADAGLFITHTRVAREKFVEYLSPLFESAHKRIVLVTARGWSRIDGALVFGHEQKVIRAGGDDKFEAVLKEGKLVHGVAGTLEGWQKNIGNPAGEHQLMTVGLCVAAAGPLLRLIEAMLFGVHFCGSTSTGKTTLLCCAASFYGHGGEKGGYIQPWTSTVNSLEKLLELTTDTLQPIDDLGATDPYPFFAAIYRLFNGVGRGRLTSSSQLQDQSTWATPVLSTGEIRPKDKLEEVRNRSETGGQEVRMVALNVERDGFEFGAFDLPKTKADGTPNTKADAAALSKAFKAAAMRDYGWAGLAYVERLMQFELEDLKTIVRKSMADFLSKLPEDMSAEVRRVADHFALCSAAGELLVRLGIVDWSPDTASAACKAAGFDAWVEDRGAATATATHDEINVVELVRRALTVHSARFLDYRFVSGHIPNPLWGYIEQDRGEAWLEREALKDIFPGMSVRNAVEAMKKTGLLKTTTQPSSKKYNNRSNQSWRTPKDSSQRHFYVVDLAVVFPPADADEADAAAVADEAADGQSPPEETSQPSPPSLAPIEEDIPF